MPGTFRLHYHIFPCAGTLDSGSVSLVPALHPTVGQAPLVASRCFSLVKALLLPACAAAVALLPHFFTSRPAFSSVGCRSSFSGLRVTSSPEPSAPSLRLMPTQCFTACVVQLLPQQLCWVPLAHFTEEDSGSQRSGEIGPRSHCLSVVDPGPGF